MRVEISIAKEKAGKMPKGSIQALKEEMTRRISKQYDDVEVIVKTASNDGLSVLWAADKEIAKEFVEETLQNTWETADDWFVR
ncbi:TPA: DinI-like family protein [Klebsiella variicola subsp. variicola]|uniref:DinI-like family protein n=1 Tax=Klebsiella variicola TaxID=244366 RepID=UPI00190E6895|nr:DinI-like family protein [Klebsiella variicola]HCB0645319.1 DinI-like family protein [Klebsiella variicola subsp. variicola]